MLLIDEASVRLAGIPDLQLIRNEPLARHTRFELGGPASILAEARTEAAFINALRVLKYSSVRSLVVGAGTNSGCRPTRASRRLLTFSGSEISGGGTRVTVQAGSSLQSLVDFAVGRGLKGLENMTGIPGQVGAAIYGNAGAYGSSISDFVIEVRYFDGERVKSLDRDGCQFRYRGSIFKQRKDWLILSAVLEFQPGGAATLAARADEILTVRNKKYPPEMRCAGSIFKNLIFSELPERVQAMVPPDVVKGGKVPSAWFLDVTGVKGMRSGGIQVADYHANLIFNAGGGTARELRHRRVETARQGALRNRPRRRGSIHWL